MPQYPETLIQHLRALGALKTYGGRREIAELPRLLASDEKIRTLTEASVGRGYWLVVVTDRRILLLDKRLLGTLVVEEIPLAHISGIATTDEQSVVLTTLHNLMRELRIRTREEAQHLVAVVAGLLHPHGPTASSALQA